jgi:hypothetical protein
VLKDHRASGGVQVPGLDIIPATGRFSPDEPADCFAPVEIPRRPADDQQDCSDRRSACGCHKERGGGAAPSDYHRIFEHAPSRLVLKGSVISGLGEGRYYMSLPHYKRQFSDALGYVPFPGTLNLQLDPVSIETRKKMEGFSWIPIDGFTAENRTFGAARCIAGRIQDIPCAIVVPGRSHYPEDIVEVISAMELRSALAIEEKDMVTVEVEV